MFNFLRIKPNFKLGLLFCLGIGAGGFAQAAVPDAPTIGTAVASGAGTVTVAFSPSVNPANPAISGFTATCGTQNKTGANSPLVVNGLFGQFVNCSVIATNADGNSAPSSVISLVVPATAPDAPTNVIAVAGNSQATVTFTAPPSNGAPIMGYSVAWNPAGGVDTNANGIALSHVLTGLTNGVSYSFTVTAFNSQGFGPVSAASSSVTPLGLVAVNSSKVHGGTTTYNLPVDTSQPFAGSITVEPRAIGSGHQLAFQFDADPALNAPWTATVTPVGAASTPTISGNNVLTTLTGVPDKQRVTVSLTGAGGAAPPVSMGFLIGDIDNSRAVDPADISSVKAQTGLATNGSNFTMDLNASGKINAADVLAVKGRNGLTLAINTAAPVTLNTTVGSNYYYEFVDPAPPVNAVWSVSGAPLPAWVTLNTVTGYLSGKPRVSDINPTGTPAFTVATNGSFSQVVTLIVTAAAPPTITTPTPASALPGATITITGTSLTGATSVFIGGVAATSFTPVSATQITAVVSALATTGNIVVTTSGGGASAPYAFTILVPGAGDYSIDNPPVLLPQPSRHPNNNPPLSHTGEIGLGQFLFPANNAYRMDASVCNSTPSIVKRWQQNIDFTEYKGLQPQDLFSMGPNDALTYKFTVPTGPDLFGGFTYETNISAGGQAPVFITVSTTPCDFDTTKVYYSGNPVFNPCYHTNGGSGTLNWTTSATPGFFECKMNKGETYYVNLRFQYAKRVIEGGNPTATSCSLSSCGGQFRLE